MQTKDNRKKVTMLLKNATTFVNNALTVTDVLIENGVITFIGDTTGDAGVVSYDLKGCLLMPGMADVHVHFREPGFTYKETIESGSRAAAAGGYTLVCAMPNLNPAPDSVENLRVELDCIAASAHVEVQPYGCITKGQRGAGELVDFKALLPDVCAFSDDGRGVQSDDLMKEAMTEVKTLDGMIAAHCEVNSLLRAGYIHDGVYAREHGHKGICSESEWQQVARDIELSRETGCRYHICHISTKETVDLVRRAKADGVNVTCETGPHYLLLTDEDLQEDGRFKMNPPLRSSADRDALLQGIQDGTIDMIATDHAPHSTEEKSKGLKGSAFGIVGLETAFPLLYSYLVCKGVISLERLIELMLVNPRKRFGREQCLRVGELANLTIMDLQHEFVIDSTTFQSMGKAQPFDGWHVKGQCVATMYKGAMVWRHDWMNEKRK